MPSTDPTVHQRGRMVNNHPWTTSLPTISCNVSGYRLMVLQTPRYRINFRLAGFPGQLFEIQQAHRIIVDTTVQGTSRKTKHLLVLTRDPYPIARPSLRLAPWRMDQGNDDLQTSECILPAMVTRLVATLRNRGRGIRIDGFTANSSPVCFHMRYSSCISLQHPGGEGRRLALV